MSFYYLTTLHKSHCVKDALLATVTLSSQPGVPCPALIISLGSKIECWDIGSSFYRKLLQEDLNFHAKHTIVVPNMLGLEDSILVMDLQMIVLFTVSNSKVKIRSHLKIPPRQERQCLDYLLLPDKANPHNYHLIIADNTSELLVVKIATSNDYHQLTGLFTVYLDDVEANLFKNISLSKESSALSFIALTGSLDTKLALTLLEIDAENRCILTNIELKDVPLNTKDGLEIFQEKVFSVVDIGNRNLVMFCSHSIKVYRLKEGNQLKCPPDRFKMPQSDSIHVQAVPNKKNGNLVFIFTSFLTSSKATYVYLIEIPPNLNLDKLAITFLGRSSVLSRPPLLISEGIFIAISEVEATEVFQITEEKNNNVERPFLRTVHVFENFGIIQQLDFNKEKKSMLVNSFKLKNNLQSFQKGLLLDSVNNFKLETKSIREIRFLTIQNQLSMVVFLKDKALIYHFGTTCNIYPEKTLQFAVPLILLNRLDQNHVFAVSHSFIAVYSVWENSKEMLKVEFDSDSSSMITSADSIGDVLAYSDRSHLTLTKYSGQKLTLIKEISPEEEIKQIKSIGDKFFVAYWFASYMDVVARDGSVEARVELGITGVHSFHTYQESGGDRVFLVGTNYGTILHKIFGEGMREKYSQEILIGKKPVKVREAAANKVFAVSDESSLLTFPAGACNVEISPLCHSELVDIFTFAYRGEDFYLLVNADSLGFGLANNSSLDNYRMKNIRLEGVSTIDRFVSVDDYYISACADQDDKACEIVVSSASSGSKVSRVLVPVGRAECMVKLRFMENWYVLLGLSVPEGPESGDSSFGELSEGMLGKLKCYLLRNGELLEIIEQDFEKPVRMINLLENGTNLLLTIGYSQLRVLKLEPKLRKLNDKSIEVTAPNLKEVHQQKFSFLIDSASVSDNFILLTDYYWVAHMLLFETIRYPRFKPIGRMTTNLNEIISAEITQKQKFIVSDRSDNLLVFGLKDKGSSDIDFTEFSSICGICLGEKILCYKKGQKANNLQFGDGGFHEMNSLGSIPYTLLGGCSGGIYILYEIPRKIHNLLEDLQAQVLNTKESEATVLKRKDFRRVGLKNKKVSFSNGIIDGDTLTGLVHMADSKGADLLKRMRHLNKPSLNEFRNLLRFFEGNPIN